MSTQLSKSYALFSLLCRREILAHSQMEKIKWQKEEMSLITTFRDSEV